MDSPAVFDGSQLAPTLIKLGEAIGILQAVPDADKAYALNPAWFENPLRVTGDSLGSNGTSIAMLFTELLGEVSAGALDLPAQDLGTMGMWNPIPNPLTGLATGFYLVNYPVDENQADGDQIFGIGILHQWQFQSDSVGDALKIAVRAWGLLPIIKIGAGGMALVLGHGACPLNMGLEFTGADGQNIVDSNGLSFNGVKVSAQLKLAPAPAVDLSVVALKLKLPTELVASDRNLSQIAQITPQEWLSTVATLFVTALQKVLNQDSRLANLLPIFGLSPIVPNEELRLPLLGWEQLFSLAHAGKPMYTPFVAWFNQLLVEDGAFVTWMGAIASLLGMQGVKAGGSGTQAEPYLVPLLADDGFGNLSLSMVTQVDAGGTRYLLPGLNFRSKGMQLGSAAAQIALQAQLDLAQFSLATSGSLGVNTSLLNLNAGFALTNTVDGQPLFAGKVGGEDYIFGSLSAGVAILQGGGGRVPIKVVPAFQLNNVSTPTGTFASIDLTQPAKLVDQALKTLYGLVDAALQEVFGLESGSSYGYQAAVMLGVIKPRLAAGQTWPAELAPPFSAAKMIGSFQNPVAALAGYYVAVVQSQTQIGAQTPLFYVLGALGALLSSVSDPVAAKGKGEMADPWLFPITSGSLPASLLAYVETLPDLGKRLTLGLQLAPEINFGSAITLDASINVAVLSLQLPLQLSAGALVATIFPGMAVQVGLPQGFTTPAVAGAAINVANTVFTGIWSRHSGWHWNMLVGQPAVIVDGNSMPVGQSMALSDKDSMQELVSKQAATFAPIVVALMGIAIYRTANRPGLAINGVLGLLPNLGPFVPKALNWPANMPSLHVSGFSDPLGDIKRQLSALLAKADFSRAALALLGWSVSNDAEVPIVAGEGTFAQPFALPFALPGGFDIAVWTDGAAQTLGAGLRRLFGVQIGTGANAIAGTSEILLRLVEVSLADAVAPNAMVPGLRLQSRITPVTPLPLTDGNTLQWFEFGLECGVADKSLVLQPLLSLTLQDGSGAQVNYDLRQLAGASSQWVAAFHGAVNAGMASLVTPLLANGAINNAYQVLQLMNLVLPLSEANGKAAINTAGWSAMLAAPLDFFRERGIALFADSATRGLAISLLQDITGIALPTVPLALLQVLHAMQLLEDEVNGFAPRVYDWTQVMAQPARQLKQRFVNLVCDPDLLAQLVAQMTNQLAPIVYGPLQMTVSEGAVFSIDLMSDVQVMLGNLLQITGGLKFDLRTGQLTGGLGLYCAQVQLDLRSQLALRFAPDLVFDFDVDLAWGDGSQPMPAPLSLYPFSVPVFLQQVQVLAPNFALATFFGQVVDARLLNNYQIARTALTALGLVVEDAGKWYMKSPLGLFDDPLKWLLGDAVLGHNGQLNIATLNKIFATITSSAVAGNGVGVAPIANGIRIFGLPYGQQIDLLADIVGQQFKITPGLADNTVLPLVDSVSLQEFSFTLALGPNFQPGFAGNIAVSGDISAGKTLLVKGGYDKGFLLSAGLVQSKQVFQVLPFPGWQTLALQAATQAAQLLLKRFTNILLDQLAATGAADFVANLRSAATQLQVSELVDILAGVTEQGVDALGTQSLLWLTERLSSANAAASIGALVTLLHPYFPQVTAQGALLRYKPSNSLPVTLLTGVQSLSGTTQLGLWIALELPASQSIVLNIEATGIGIPLQPNGSPMVDFVPQVQFQFSVLAPLQDGAGPKLEMHFDMAKLEFVLGMDPAGSSVGNSSYYRELLPTFFGETDKAEWGKAVLSWLESLLLNIVPRYVSIVVLNQASVKAWLEQPLFGAAAGTAANGVAPSAAKILKAAQLVIQTTAEKEVDRLYMLNSLEALQALTIEKFLAGFLRCLLENEYQLLKIGEGGGIWIGPRVAGGDYFGLRVMLPDIALAAVPYVTFQLGDESTAWIANAGGDKELKGGISLYVPISEDAPDFAKTVLELVNIGLDFVGKENQNLVQLDRFSMRAIQPRGLITFDFSQSNPVSGYGGGVTLSNVGISLAPNVATPGADVNPVAQNLLGSGTASAQQKENPVANPTFSVRTSYVSKLFVELFSDDDTSTTKMWFPVQRSFGPLYANKIGVGWRQDDYVLDMLFDGNVTLAGLFVGFDTLSVGVPVKTPLDFGKYQLELAGIDINFEGGSVEITGAFLKQDMPLRYDGSAIIKAGKFGISALGSYALVPVDPNKPDGETAASMFIFANLNLPLGPVPAFFINGLAAGFGYNRNILIPDLDGIADFPLVKGAIDPSVFGGANATPDSALATLSQVVYPEIGQYWLAGGIQFSTYELLNSFALLIVRFGREFAIDMIGITTASFPPNATPANALAYVELGILASFRPSQGMVSVRAQLTPSSFVLSKDCHLTGGFAAVIWYDGEHAGDFVVTLGGYNPAFVVPDYFPAVPQLGFSWPMDLGFGTLSISGGTYFALTSSAIMAGGFLKVLFKTGPLWAWFSAGVDFLIQWKPFYIVLNAAISVGAGIVVTVAGVSVTLSAELGARLLLWGPPIAGKVDVDWFVISFSIPFGDTSQAQPTVAPLVWDAFQESFLPPLQIAADDTSGRTAAQPRSRLRAHPRLLRMQQGMPQPTPILTQAYTVLKAQIEQGLLDDFGALGWVISTPFVLNVNTVIPSTALTFGGSASVFSGPAIGIQPMAQPAVDTPLSISILGWDVGGQCWQAVDLDQRLIAVDSLNNGTAEALWSKLPFDPNGVPEAKIIPNSIIGARLAGLDAILYFPVGPMALAALGFVTLGPLPLPYAWTPDYPPQPVGSQQNRAQVIAASIMAPDIVAIRDAIYSALRQFGQPALVSPSLVVLQSNIGNVFQSPPSLVPLAADLLPVGVLQVRSGRSVAQPAPRMRAAPAAQAGHATQLIGCSLRYRANTRPAAVGRAADALGVTRWRSRAQWIAGQTASRAKLNLLGNASGDTFDLHLAPGHTSIVRLGSQAARKLQVQGDLPLRLCSFNRYQEPVQHCLLDPMQCQRHDLPNDADVLVAIANESDGQAVMGWYHDGDLTRINHYYFHSGNCLVRPQAVPGMGKAKFGSMSAGSVLACNQVQRANGSLANGWLETLFLEDIASLAVIVEGAEPPRVQMCWSEDLALPAYDSASVAASVQQVGGAQIHLFAVPPRSAANAVLAVLVNVGVTAKAGASCLYGVLGFADQADVLARQGMGGILACHAGKASHRAPPSTQLQIS